mmetsp:Transcript_12265/g.18808  ORF Transcript_12265/g.18808 Transcript_12265/m.18808 type:complete len:351 (+) Transcript_12265:26-1078(+)
MTTPISQHESVVEHIRSRLPSDEARKISDELFHSTVEGLRILAIKARVGTLGRKDTMETRAASLIHYFLRTKTSQTIPIAKLASTCGMKGKDLGDLSRKLENYVTNTTTPGRIKRRSTGKTPGKSQKKKEKRSTFLTTSVRLGSEIPNSSWFAQKAEQLFQDMKEQVRRTVNVHQRNDYLNDIQRNQTVYEAACFYFLVEKELSKEQDILSILLEATKVSKSEFRDVYPTARKFFDQMEKVKQIKTKRELERKRYGNDGTIVEKNHKKAKIEVTSDDMGIANANSVIEKPTKDAPPKKFFYSKSFQEWKSSILEKAIQTAKQKCNKDEISRLEALKIAADSVAVSYASKA